MKTINLSVLLLSLIYETNNSKLDVSVFSNPASDQLNFQLPVSEKFVSIRLYRIDGQLVRKKDGIRNNNVILKRESLSSGTYIYQIQTENGRTVNGKIILK